MSAADEADRWFSQADADLAAARDNAEDHPHVACFLAQQAAETALKGAQLRQSGVTSRTHSLSQLNTMLRGLGCSLDAVSRQGIRNLERMYTETRYPDVLPDATPAEYFTTEDAREAIQQAEAIVTIARELRQPEQKGTEAHQTQKVVRKEKPGNDPDLGRGR